MMEDLVQNKGEFVTTIEVVPPEGYDAGPLMDKLTEVAALPINGFSVATNPVAKPRMSAMATCSLIQTITKREAVLHCTTRDHNRIGLQGELWGAKALGLKTVMVATGDRVALKNKGMTSTVGDVDVYQLIEMARQSDLITGVVFDTHPEINGIDTAVRRLKQKADAGAQFAVTQPVYDQAGVDQLLNVTKDIGIPIILGILPLRTPRHADFLHEKVAGIAVSEAVRKQMHQAKDPVAAGVANAREQLKAARQSFAGACIMPPFDHYEVLQAILD